VDRRRAGAAVRSAGLPNRAPRWSSVTADHGESLGEHGEATHSVFAYEPVPEGATDRDGCARAAAPAPRRAAAARSTRRCRHVDLLPTILDVTASPADPALPGVSLRPLIASGRRPDLPSYFEAMTSNVTRGWAPLRGVLVGPREVHRPAGCRAL
jgi:arylsulfatase A-like enzyme